MIVYSLASAHRVMGRCGIAVTLVFLGLAIMLVGIRVMSRRLSQAEPDEGSPLPTDQDPNGRF